MDPLTDYFFLFGSIDTFRNITERIQDSRMDLLDTPTKDCKHDPVNPAEEAGTMKYEPLVKEKQEMEFQQYIKKELSTGPDGKPNLPCIKREKPTDSTVSGTSRSTNRLAYIKSEPSDELPSTKLEDENNLKKTAATPLKRKRSPEAEDSSPVNCLEHEVDTQQEQYADDCDEEEGHSSAPQSKGAVSRYNHACAKYKKDISSLNDSRNLNKATLIDLHDKTLDFALFMKDEHDFQHSQYQKERISRAEATAKKTELQMKLKMLTMQLKASESKVEELKKRPTKTALKAKTPTEQEVADLRAELKREKSDKKKLKTLQETATAKLSDNLAVQNTMRSELLETNNRLQRSKVRADNLIARNMQLESEVSRMQRKIDSLERQSSVALTSTASGLENKQPQLLGESIDTILTGSPPCPEHNTAEEML